jgi:hypothetical protein
MLQNDINAILRTSAENCQKMIILTLVKTIQFERFFPLFHKIENYNSIPFQNSICRQNWIKIELWRALSKLCKIEEK